VIEKAGESAEEEERGEEGLDKDTKTALLGEEDGREGAKLNSWPG